MSSVRIALPLAMAVILLSGCAGFGEQPDITRNWPARQLYSAAKSSLSRFTPEMAVESYMSLLRE